MELTSFTDYSLRVLIYLAGNQAERSSIDELAEFYKVSRHHLAKIVKRLSELGYVETMRGKGGGVCLAVAPEQVNLAQVIRGTEPHLNLVECFSADQAHNCVIHGNCLLKGVLWQAQGHFFAHLEKYSLADVIANQVAPSR